jgi:hypothetical protein
LLFNLDIPSRVLSPNPTGSLARSTQQFCASPSFADQLSPRDSGGIKGKSKGPRKRTDEDSPKNFFHVAELELAKRSSSPWNGAWINHLCENVRERTVVFAAFRTRIKKPAPKKACA